MRAKLVDPTGKQVMAVSIRRRAARLVHTLLRSSKLQNVALVLEATAEVEVVPSTTVIASISQLQSTPSILSAIAGPH